LHCNVYKTENPQKGSRWSILNWKMRHLKEPLRFDIANMYCLDIKEWNGTENLKINQLGKKLLHCNYYKTESPQKGSRCSILNGKLSHWKGPLRFYIANMYCLYIKEWNGTATLKIKHLRKILLHCIDFKTESPLRGSGWSILNGTLRH
jgi:hypothetical protein